MRADIFEVAMLICFGVAWPFSIHKLIKTKRSHGKSLIFLAVIFLGYVCGMLFQWFGQRNAVIFMYMLNAAMVLTDFLLTIKYRKHA